MNVVLRQSSARTGGHPRDERGVSSFLMHSHQTPFILSLSKGVPVLIFICTFLYGLLPNPASAEEQIPAIVVLVAYHSRSGYTEKMAREVAEGAKAVSGTRVVLKRVGDVTAPELFSSDAVIVGSPVYWANMAGEGKNLFFKRPLQFGGFPNFKWRIKVAPPFITAVQPSAAKELLQLPNFPPMLVTSRTV